MVRAMPLVNEGHRLLIVGSCPPDLLNEAKDEKGWKAVDYYPAVPFDEVHSMYRRSSIGLILYENVGQYHLASAVKLFEFLAWGMPVVMPNFGEWVTFNQEVQCGINVDPSDHDAVSKAINTLLDNPSMAQRLAENGRKAVSTGYSWESEAPNLIRLYQDILGC